MIKRIYGSTKALEKGLDAAWQRNEAIAHNLANVDTPGFKRKKVEFEEHLNNALKSSLKGFRTNSRHIPIGQRSVDEIEIRIMEDSSDFSMRLDGNNVDIDSEMAQLAKNTIKYNTLAQSLNTSLRRIKSAVNEGRK